MNATKTVGAYEAKTHLPALLDFVAKGREVKITRHGKPIARLVAIEKPASNREVVDRLLAFRGCLKLAPGETIRDLVNAGRKY
jgi:prevent-host-death family protein